jgi:hypothetical protein
LFFLLASSYNIDISFANVGIGILPLWTGSRVYPAFCPAIAAVITYESRDDLRILCNMAIPADARCDTVLLARTWSLR